VIAVAFDARETSHMSAGVLAYSRKLREWLPRIGGIRLIEVGTGDNFDFAEQIGLPRAIARSGAALAHFPTLYVPRFVPGPYVVTIHDLIDLHYPHYVKWHVGPYIRSIVGPVARGARAIITDDDATADDLERYLHVERGRVHVVPLGYDDPPRAVEPAVHPRPYVLYVGNRRPHKNLATLAQAWAQLPADAPVDLVLSGDPEDRLCDTTGPGEIVFLGARSDADLRRWYAGAAVYAHPALREGFGLPLLEAMRNGAPVVASRGAVPRSLAPHAVVVDATDVGAWRTALLRFLRDSHAAADAAAAAATATAELTWERTARLTADVYARALA
jgi:glycosyltransferase involved in cell wall biosynthesis